MATKRDISSITEPHQDGSYPQSNTKRARNTSSQKAKQQESATDVTYGQRCCFPGINQGGTYSDDDIEFEDESDALAYLQSVRNEASGIPHLLVAPKSGPQLPPGQAADELDYGHADGDEHIDRSIYDDGQGDTRGYYKDGAYTAAPFPEQTIPGDDDDNDNDDDNPDSADDAAKIGDAYFASQRAHFLSLRRHLHQAPPASALASLSKEQAPYVGKFGSASKTFTIWSVRVRYSDPHPAQIAAMDKGAVFRLLRVILGGKFLRRGVELRERTSRWLWALLARLPDRGELDHIEVGHIRELGKRAAVLMHSLQQMAMLREEVELGGHDEDDNGDADEAAWVGEDEDEDAEVDAQQYSLVAKTVDDGDVPPEQPTSDPDHPVSIGPTTGVPETNNGKVDVDIEDGEIADDESVPMDIEEDMENVKARLLANLDAACESTGPLTPSSQDAGQKEEASFDPVRARMNMRATLNMIITVAGEFYGQRDLLEFRDPFRGI